MPITWLPISQRDLWLIFPRKQLWQHKQQSKLVYFQSLSGNYMEKENTPHPTLPPPTELPFPVFIMPYELTIQIKFSKEKDSKIFNCSNFSCVSYTWIAGCGSISSLSQSLKALTEFFSSWLVCFCFCLFPFKKSGQWTNRGGDFIGIWMRFFEKEHRYLRVYKSSNSGYIPPGKTGTHN